MSEFLKLLPPEDALIKLLAHLPPGATGSETVAIEAAAGRTPAEGIAAPEALPPFPRSTVDGYAARAADTFGAGDSLPAYLTVIGEVPMGRAAGLTLNPGQVALIHTGGMLPEGADAVVMLEHTQRSRPGEVEVLKAAGMGENVLLTGEDVNPGDVVVAAGQTLRPAEIGGLAGLGIVQVRVARKPRIGILSSGDEVVPPAEPLQPGQVRDVNSYSLGALIEQHGG
ncbi:MAG TPA: molybdopterin molybdotransferase MoeA, partial [Anaerolineaceae bacterium]|nr:molybdopterin molybdotransferase MoeA [Anaerolineaceae bacterium]